jgi:starch phosphorylase
MNKGEIGRQIVDSRRNLDQKWSTVHFGEVKVETRGDQHVFEVQVVLNELDPGAVRIELYADGVSPMIQEMERVRQIPGVQGGYVCGAAVSATRPSADYTARMFPFCDGVAIPLEEPRILWQR